MIYRDGSGERVCSVFFLPFPEFEHRIAHLVDILFLLLSLLFLFTQLTTKPARLIKIHHGTQL